MHLLEDMNGRERYHGRTWIFQKGVGQSRIDGWAAVWL
jgi:hypothetical protein